MSSRPKTPRDRAGSPVTPSGSVASRSIRPKTPEGQSLLEDVVEVCDRSSVVQTQNPRGDELRNVMTGGGGPGRSSDPKPTEGRSSGLRGPA